jgi:hypothetical protein
MIKRPLFAALLSQALVSTAYAQGNGTGGGTPPGTIRNQLSSPDLQTFFLNVIEIIVTLGTYVLVVAIIYVGFLFVTAGGNEKKIGDARNALFYTVIGGAILLGAWVIATAIANTVTAL